MIQERYRKDYDGEFIIIRTSIRNGKKYQEREWIENPIENNYISARAVVIGSGESRQHFPIHRLQGHKGGLLGKKRLQSYGSEGCWQELQCDFYVDSVFNEHDKLIEFGISEKVPVYTDAKNCIKYVGEFFMIPYNISFNSDAALAMYIAAFDGHSEVYCVGVDALDENFKPKTKIVKQIESVIKVYKNTNFIFVNNSKTLHSEWRNYTNVSLIDYSKFITVCDI